MSLSTVTLFTAALHFSFPQSLQTAFFLQGLLRVAPPHPHQRLQMKWMKPSGTWLLYRETLHYTLVYSNRSLPVIGYKARIPDWEGLQQTAEKASKWNNGRLRERALPNVFELFENWFILTDPTNPMYSQAMDEGWKVSFVRNPLVHSWEQKLFVNRDRNLVCTRHSYVSSKLPFHNKSCSRYTEKWGKLLGAKNTVSPFCPPWYSLNWILVFPPNGVLY